MHEDVLRASECAACTASPHPCARAGVALLLWELMPEEAAYEDAIQGFCNSYLQPFRTVPHTLNGLAYPYHGVQN